MLTNRRKVLSESSTLAYQANEDVISPEKEIVLVIQSANNKSQSASQGGSCELQKIGLTYKDSAMCYPERVQPPKGAPNVVYIGLSMAYTFEEPDAENRKSVQYFSMWGSRGLWYDNWKAVTMHPHNSGGNFDQDVWQLYNHTEDFSEAHDLASENPQKVQEMTERWWAEAGKYNVLPLDDRAHMDVPPGPKGRFTYYPGMATIYEPGIPDTKYSSYSISADVDIPEEGSEGVLLSIGGRFGGLTLYVQDKHLVFDSNYVGLSHTTITSLEEVPVGESTLGFRFDKTGEVDIRKQTGATGTGTLLINGEEVGNGTIAPTTPIRYSWEEGLEIGVDRLTPVTESYTSPFEFTGILKKVVLEVEG